MAGEAKPLRRHSKLKRDVCLVKAMAGGAAAFFHDLVRSRRGHLLLKILVARVAGLLKLILYRGVIGAWLSTAVASQAVERVWNLAGRKIVRIASKVQRRLSGGARAASGQHRHHPQEPHQEPPDQGRAV